MPRLVGLRLELLADVGHVHAQVMGVLLGLGPPKLPEHLAVGHDLSAVDGEEPAATPFVGFSVRR